MSKPFRFRPGSKKCAGAVMALLTNDERADAAQVAVDAFLQYVGEAGVDDIRDNIGDLMVNLLHLGDREGVNTESLLRMTEFNWKEER